MRRTPRSIVFLGEAMLDLICEHSASSPADVDCYVPHLGGAAANAAVAAARLGGPAAICGGVGDDAWGGWLRRRLQLAGVDTSCLEPVGGCATQLALINVDDSGEPQFTTYGDSIKAIEAGLSRHLDRALSCASVLYLSSHCLRSHRQKEFVSDACAKADARSIPLVLDVNWRPERWRADIDSDIRRFAARVALLKVTDTEARALSGHDDVALAARALVEAGARVVLVTLGCDGAIVQSTDDRSLIHANPVPPRSSVGAGDNLIGALLAGLDPGRIRYAEVAAALPGAMLVAAEATQRWGAAA